MLIPIKSIAEVLFLFNESTLTLTSGFSDLNSDL